MLKQNEILNKDLVNAEYTIYVRWMESFIMLNNCWINELEY